MDREATGVKCNHEKVGDIAFAILIETGYKSQKLTITDFNFFDK